MRFKLTEATLLRAACHSTAHVGVALFSGKIVPAGQMRLTVVHTDNQSIPKLSIWLSVATFDGIEQPGNHYYKP